MRKLFPLALVMAFGAMMFICSCGKTPDNPEGNYTCYCYFSDSVHVDTFSTTYEREPMSTAKTQCAYTQAKYVQSNPGYTGVTCTINR